MWWEIEIESIMLIHGFQRIEIDIEINVEVNIHTYMCAYIECVRRDGLEPTVYITINIPNA